MQNIAELYKKATEKKPIRSEKALKTASQSTHRSSHNTCLTYVPHAQADQA